MQRGDGVSNAAQAASVKHCDDPWHHGAALLLQ
jgi:hypothetical protein